MVQVVAQMVQRRFMHHACFLLRWWARTLGMSYRGNTGTRGTLGTISELGTNAEPLSAEQQRTRYVGTRGRPCLCQACLLWGLELRCSLRVAARQSARFVSDQSDHSAPSVHGATSSRIGVGNLIVLSWGLCTPLHDITLPR